MTPASVADYRDLARRKLPRMLFDYIDGGSYGEVTLGRNTADFEAVALRQRVMRDMTGVETGVELQGRKWSMPIGLSPVGMGGLFARRGEVQAARAAAAAGVPFCLSTVGVCPVEEVANGATAPWFQLYMIRDRGYVRALLERVRAAGCPVLVLTVDLPTPGARRRDIRSGLTGRPDFAGLVRRACQGAMRPAWLWDVWLRGRPHRFGNVADAIPAAHGVDDYWGWIGENFDPAVTWNDLDWIRQVWDRPIVVKGVLDAEDSRDAARAGAQGLVVSNHGGRQLDGAVSSIRALPRIADAVGDELEVYLDGGVRSGLDVLKALAHGARACFVGRPWAFALAAGGEVMVEKLLETFRAELRTAMVLTGCASASSVGHGLIDQA